MNEVPSIPRIGQPGLGRIAEMLQLLQDSVPIQRRVSATMSFRLMIMFNFGGLRRCARVRPAADAR